jgi:hypothetical protein
MAPWVIGCNRRPSSGRSTVDSGLFGPLPSPGETRRGRRSRVHGARAGDAYPREAGRKDDEVPRAIARSRRHDHSLGAECPSPPGELVRSRPRAREGVQAHVQLRPDLEAPQVEHRKVGGVDPPQAPALLCGIDGSASGGAPLRPYRRRLERCVQRPRLAGTVVATLGWRRVVGRQGRRVEARLTVDAAGKAADRVQT